MKITLFILYMISLFPPLPKPRIIASGLVVLPMLTIKHEECYITRVLIPNVNELIPYSIDHYNDFMTLTFKYAPDNTALIFYHWTDIGSVNFKVCNWTKTDVIHKPIPMRWRVIRATQ